MFSLIITIVSIALVVALVAATMYHGGDTLTQGRTSADASAFVTGAQQIAAAKLMSDAMGSASADVAALVTGNFLSSEPSVKGGAWSFANASGTGLNFRNVANAGPIAEEVCVQINKNAGAAVGSDNYFVGGADDAAINTAMAALPYACATTGVAADRADAGQNKFVFKF